MLAEATSVLAGVDMGGITDQIKAGIPLVIPVVISVLAIKKGVKFVLGMIKGV